MSVSESTIVVGTDGSENASQAVDWAAREASLRGVSLEVLHAHPDSWPARLARPSHSEAPTDDESAHVLEVARSRVLEHHPDLDVRLSSVRQSPAAALVHRSRTAHLLVVGSHGRSAVGRLVLGSVSGHAIAYSQCPTVVVRGSISESDRPIAVGVDDSEASRHALRVAFEEAALRDVPLTVFHAWQLPPVTGYGIWGFPEDVEAEFRGEAVTVLENAMATSAAKYPQVRVVERVMETHPVTAAIDECHLSQLLVVGTRGGGAFPGVALGSLPAAAVREAACPVMVVPVPRGIDLSTAATPDRAAANA